MFRSMAMAAPYLSLPRFTSRPPARLRAGAGTVQTYYIAPSTAFTSSSTAAAESYSPLK